MKKLTDYEIRKYQLKVLGKVDEFCRNNNIKYFLEGGTLLGAIRHDGYIPWDDDIDIMMPRGDYNKFLKLFNQEHGDYYAYALETHEKYNIHFCKISYEKTLLIEENLVANDMEIGVNIDLFPVDNIPIEDSGDILLKKLHFLEKLMYCKAHRWETLKNKPIKQQISILVHKLLAFFISKRALGEKQSVLAQQFNAVETEYCSEITCHFRKALPHWHKNNFKVIKHVFEGREYNIPQGYDDILTQQYGDYMQLPPVEERIAQHGFKAWLKE